MLMVQTWLVLLAAGFMLPAQAQWDPHGESGRCENAAGFITVGSSTVCIGQREVLVGSDGLLSADGVVSADGVRPPELLAGLPPLSEALRFCDTLLDEGDEYSTGCPAVRARKRITIPRCRLPRKPNPTSCT